MNESRWAGVLGTGVMGPQIAVSLAGIGYCVRLYNYQEAPDIQSKLNHWVRLLGRRKGWSKEQGAAIVQRITVTTRLEDLASVQIVIEAIVEDLAIKKALFAKLDALCPSAKLLATNTSSLDIAAIAAATQHPERVLGLHFFNPIHDTGLVEVLLSPKTTPDTADIAIEMAQALDKVPLCAAESCVNRILIPMINEACFALESGLSTAENIDRAMKLGANHPLGPLGLADLIGLDVVVNILRTFTEKHGSRYTPAPLLLQHVQEGKLGRKAGEGFFRYDRGKN